MKQNSYAKLTNTPAKQAENNECMIVQLKSVRKYEYLQVNILGLCFQYNVLYIEYLNIILK